jgi:hypothetical protein
MIETVHNSIFTVRFSCSNSFGTSKTRKDYPKLAMPDDIIPVLSEM